MAIDKEKLKAIESVVSNLEKAYGKGTLMQMGNAPLQKIDAIRLDVSLSIML